MLCTLHTDVGFIDVKRVVASDSVAHANERHVLFVALLRVSLRLEKAVSSAWQSAEACLVEASPDLDTEAAVAICPSIRCISEFREGNSK